MAIIITNINHETGDINTCGYSALITDGGLLHVDAAAKIHGNFGLSALCDGGTDPERAHKSFTDTKRIRVRFHMDISGFTIVSPNTDTIFAFYDRGTGALKARIRITNVAGTYKIGIAITDDANTETGTGTFYTVSEFHTGQHTIECDYFCATNPGDNNGFLTLWVDGVQIASITGIDNDTRNCYDVGMGLVVGPNATDTGEIHFDDLTANDDGGEIGGYIDPGAGALLYGFNGDTSLENPVHWPDWDNGAAGAVTVSGDANWGKLELITGAEGRSQVIDFGDSNPRTYTITENVYGSGQGDADLEIRGDTNPFAQDDVSPAWDAYVGPVLESWRYVQIRESRE